MEPKTISAKRVELDRLESAAKSNVERTYSIFFQSATQNLPVFKVDINLPMFRMENGRTKRKQIEFRHKHPSRSNELDDASSTTAQTIQFDILREMATEANLLELLKQGQQEPLLLSNDGFVVNGNRRLAAMRILHNDPAQAKSGIDFSHIFVARLPILDEKEIRRIEQRLQLSKDGKADYNWVDELLTIKSNIDDYGMSIAELAKDMNRRQPAIRVQLQMLKLIDLYLDKMGKRGLYFEVESDEQAFKTLAKGYNRYDGDAIKQSTLLDIAFPIIAHNQSGDSKHKRIGAIIENLQDIAAIVNAKSPQSSDDSDDPDDILSSISNGDTPLASGAALSLDEKSSDLVHEAIKDIARQRELQNMANGPSEAVAQAATLLKNIEITSSMTKIKQFRGQLKAIKTTCDELLAALDNGSFDHN